MCFGYEKRKRRGTAEMVQLSWNNNGTGTWIQLTEDWHGAFSKVFLTSFIAAVGEYVIIWVTNISTRSLFKITYLHSRGKVV